MVKNIKIIITLTNVTIHPILKKSIKLNLYPLLSALSRIIKLLAAPIIVKLPASVLPAANAIHALMSLIQLLKVN